MERTLPRPQPISPGFFVDFKQLAVPLEWYESNKRLFLLLDVTVLAGSNCMTIRANTLANQATRTRITLYGAHFYIKQCGMNDLPFRQLT